MIKIPTKYPWGVKDINYDLWILKSFIKNRKDKSGNELPDLEMGVMEARTQEEYEHLIGIFQDNWKVDEKAESFKASNSHYYEVQMKAGHIFVTYIQGFLSSEQ